MYIEFPEAYNIPLERKGGRWYLTTISYIREQNKDTTDHDIPEPRSAEFPQI